MPNIEQTTIKSGNKFSIFFNLLRLVNQESTYLKFVILTAENQRVQSAIVPLEPGLALISPREPRMGLGMDSSIIREALRERIEIMGHLRHRLPKTGRFGKRLWSSRGVRALTVLLLIVGLWGCGGDRNAPQALLEEPTTASNPLTGRIAEVSPPDVIQALRPGIDQAQPQVSILSPRPEQVINADRVSVRFSVKDLSLFKSDLGLGPHLHVFLDDQPYRAVYDPSQPLELTDLAPGTHTLRVFASRPWHESFKNQGAYAQTTFHLYTRTATVDPEAPQLTYSRPQGSYGAEPIMLDFYLNNAPLHLVAQEDPEDELKDWRVRCTINGQSFVFDQWQPIYLKGFQRGTNWVQLELIDETGEPLAEEPSTVRLITYEPGGEDTLAKMVRGDVTPDQVRAIVEQGYVYVPTPEPAPEPEPPAAVEEPEPEPVMPVEEPVTDSVKAADETEGAAAPETEAADLSTDQKPVDKQSTDKKTAKPEPAKTPEPSEPAETEPSSEIEATTAPAVEPPASKTKGESKRAQKEKQTAEPEASLKQPTAPTAPADAAASKNRDDVNVPAETEPTPSPMPTLDPDEAVEIIEDEAAAGTTSELEPAPAASSQVEDSEPDSPNRSDSDSGIGQ